MTKTNFKYYLSFLFLFVGYYSTSSSNPDKSIKSNYFRHSDTSIIVSNVRVDLLFPNCEIKGTILVLPGWNFKCNDICLNSDFCKLFINEGYILILPDMLKSIYTTKLYPETRKDWLPYRTLHWITDTLIPLLQKQYHLLLPKRNNYLFGISTGARGVAMLAINTDSIFIAGAGLSGDYNPLSMLSDDLNRGYLGPFEQFSERWTGKDNPQKNAGKLKIPLFLAHGKADNIVPCSQTTEFYSTITKLNPKLDHRLNLNDTASHNYGFWQSEYKNVLKFFNQHKIYQVLKKGAPYRHPD